MWFYVIVTLLLLIYYLFRKHASFWENLGIPGPKPLPVVGNIGLNFVGKENMAEIFKDIYLNYKEYPLVGIYKGSTPCLMLRDPEIIKNILVKDFQYFLNNDVFVDKEADPLLGRNPFVLKNEEWKTSRQQLAPSFSSGKIKAIFLLVEDVSERLVKYLKDQAPTETPLDTKEICTKFTCDNVAVCALGLEGKCFEEPNSEFRELARQVVSPESLQGFKFALSLTLPKILNLFSVKLLPKQADDRFIDIVTKNIEYRKKNNVVRNDFFDTIIQQLKTTPTVPLIDVAAHVTNFFLDGVETSAIATAFVLLDLAINQECQTKLRDEIVGVLKKHNSLSYEALQEMTYLEACINESLRMHPPLPVLNKTCTKRYTIKATNPEYKKLTVTIEPETPVVISVLGLHMDPKYFPEPEKYNPERFLSKENTHKYVYMPFGDGPRICIGQRFGMLQIKIGVTQIIRNFRVTLNKKTLMPLQYMPYYFLLYPKGGIWLNFCKV